MAINSKWAVSWGYYRGGQGTTKDEDPTHLADRESWTSNVDIPYGTTTGIVTIMTSNTANEQSGIGSVQTKPLKREAPVKVTRSMIKSDRKVARNAKQRYSSHIEISYPNLLANSSKFLGISYAPYRSSSQCKSQYDVNDDLARLEGQYDIVRIYGTDCDQVQKTYRAAKKYKFKLFLGIWNISAFQYEAQEIIAGINGDWDIVHTVSVGNELVNTGQADSQVVINIVRTTRQILREAGYKGPVVAVDTFAAVEAHKELCDESDYCAFNAHAFFDSTVAAADTGRWLSATIARVESTLVSMKKIVVTETGWPTHGSSNGRAVPGLKNQQLAIESIKQSVANHCGDVILFSAYNDLWKSDTTRTFNAERYWGIGGAVANCNV